jgi:RNA binding exosome subunit
MSVIIHKDESDKAVEEAIQSVINKKKKDRIDLDRYFGKISYEVGGGIISKKDKR